MISFDSLEHCGPSDVHLLTRHKRNLAQHDPAQRKVQIQLHKSTDAVVQLDGHVARMLHHQIGHVRVAHRLAAKVPAAATSASTTATVAAVRHAEVEFRVPEHLHVLAELVVGVDDDGAEVAHAVELEHQFDGLAGAGGQRVVAPADPLVTCVRACASGRSEE